MKFSSKKNLLSIGWDSFLFIILIGFACGDDDSESPCNDLLMGSLELLREEGDLVDYGTWSFLTNTKVHISYEPGDRENFDITSINSARLMVEDDDEYELIKVCS